MACCLVLYCLCTNDCLFLSAYNLYTLTDEDRRISHCVPTLSLKHAPGLLASRVIWLLSRLGAKTSVVLAIVFVYLQARLPSPLCGAAFSHAMLIVSGGDLYTLWIRGDSPGPRAKSNSSRPLLYVSRSLWFGFEANSVDGLTSGEAS